MPEPTGFRGNIFTGAGLQQGDLAADDRITAIENFTRKYGVGERPLRALRAGAVPGIVVAVHGVVMRQHRQIPEAVRMLDHFPVRRAFE